MCLFMSKKGYSREKKKHEMIVIFVNDVAVMCKMCPSYFLLYYFYESFSSWQSWGVILWINAFNKQTSIYKTIL